jgi:hypothetical protein
MSGPGHEVAYVPESVQVVLAKPIVIAPSENRSPTMNPAARNSIEIYRVTNDLYLMPLI